MMLQEGFTHNACGSKVWSYFIAEHFKETVHDCLQK